MININRNNSLEALQQLVEQNIDTKLSYMPDSFNKEQHHALELFKQRLFLEKTIDEAISFNRNLVFENSNPNLHLATTAEDLIDVFKLRSDVYTQINYQDEFPDTIEGLNFDKYDSNSAILFYKNNKMVTGTIRVIFDSDNKLPSEDKFPFDDMRNNYNMVVEISRIIVEKGTTGLNLEFKYLMYGLYNIFIYNNMDITLFGIKKEHYKLYSKFGGMTILKELNSYGTFTVPCLILSWDPSKASNFFKRAFLN
ncbi:MAG: hypothetical protein KAJ49_09615 [Arcobacteraceae bacterium]|nr:hypothetical protein [Arcobacteraceae bacterium]